MPSGKVHDRITVIGAALAAPAWFYLTPKPPDYVAGTALVAAILVSGLALSPDLDLESTPYRRWGFFRFFWWPYRKLTPHRSWISHSFVLGPLLRISYFLFIVWGVFRACSWVVDRYIVPVDRNTLSRQWGDALIGLWHTHPYAVQMALLGLVVGAALHTLADLYWSGVKRGLRKPRRYL